MDRRVGRHAGSGTLPSDQVSSGGMPMAWYISRARAPNTLFLVLEEGIRKVLGRYVLYVCTSGILTSLHAMQSDVSRPLGLPATPSKHKHKHVRPAPYVFRTDLYIHTPTNSSLLLSWASHRPGGMGCGVPGWPSLGNKRPEKQGSCPKSTCASQRVACAEKAPC